MHRAPLGNTAYWDGRIKKFGERIEADKSNMGFPAKNPGTESQYWFNHSRYSFRLIMLRYSRGDPVEALLQGSFQDLLDSWAHANLRALEWQRAGGKRDSREWLFSLHNLNYYNWCFWVAGLALLLDVPDEQWNRLLNLIGNIGRDRLLDSVLATRQGGRKIGSDILHPKPYARLMLTIDAPRSQQAPLLAAFVQHWYAELARKSGDELWWHVYGDPARHPLDKGSYFGRWCIEAAVVAKMFDLDDSLCLAEEHYPGALLHPESEHVAIWSQQSSLLSRLRSLIS
ncbi:PoNe immunity protein domain-containing protein [Massilia sp. S19_KUP03_FR1]|uniref:PoNe immunity protein domain-containing protein n=1 Tax=Massilia sp. S19_KUP03_FR1 TaxID=3025503 RepID=UPI002FCDCB59